MYLLMYSIIFDKKFEDVQVKVNVYSDVTKLSCDSDSDSLETIDFRANFSSCKSQMERVYCEEDCLIAREDEKLTRKDKRKLALSCWKWEEVVDLCKDEDSYVVLSFIPLKKKVKVSIQSRNRVLKLFDELDDDE
ncbi:unnamed protein product [Lactuca saligna]|uniref:Uncharacterized protein n=1 Tax=Lactuca saligna TaxID=75948 RepID=A0AA35ZSM8_LACSI|nr:unnamed protein product [Lactuca saligna]